MVHMKLFQLQILVSVNKVVLCILLLSCLKKTFTGRTFSKPCESKSSPVAGVEEA